MVLIQNEMRALHLGFRVAASLLLFHAVRSFGALLR